MITPIYARSCAVCSAIASISMLAMMATVANAQNQNDEEELGEIVVTGTQIKGDYVASITGSRGSGLHQVLDNGYMFNIPSMTTYNGKFLRSPGLLGRYAWIGSGYHWVVRVHGPFLQRCRVDGHILEAEPGHDERVGRGGDTSAAVSDRALFTIPLE